MFAAETMFLHLCVDRVREKIFHEKTGLGMFGDDRGKRASLAANAEPAVFFLYLSACNRW